MEVADLLNSYFASDFLEDKEDGGLFSDDKVYSRGPQNGKANTNI